MGALFSSQKHSVFILISVLSLFFFFFFPIDRSADDAKMNSQLKQVFRADDPMAAFLTKSRPKGRVEKPKYKGPAPPPNRFGIQPGHRWDGVDRSNGFESMMYQKINERGRNEREARGECPEGDEM